MKKNVTFFFFIFVCFLSASSLQAQDRFTTLGESLRLLSQNVPSLNNKPQVSLSDMTLHGFLRSLAEIHQLNLNVDPGLNQKIVANYSNETIINILLDLARQHNLDFRFTGSIITVVPYKDPLANLPPAPKALQITYQPENQELTMDLENDSLLTVAKKITQLSNKNVIVLPGLFDRKISGYIQGLPVGNALEKLAIANNFKLNRTNDDVFVLEPLAPNEQIVARQTGIPNSNFTIRQTGISGTATSSISITEESGKKMVNLDILATPLSDAIKNIADQSGISYFIYSELTGVRTAKVNNMLFDDALSFLLQGTANTFRVENGIYMIGNRQEEGLRSYKLIQLHFRSVDSLLALIPSELKKGVDMKEFDEYNSFLVSGSQPQINEIEQFVKAMDKIVPVVMVEFIIMDIQKSRTVSTGLQFGISDSLSQRSGGTLFGGTDFTFSSGDINRFISQIGLNNAFNIGRVAPSFYATLRALEQNSDIELRQTPKLSTLNGHEASYSTGVERFYVVENVFLGGGLTPTTTTSKKFEKVEAKLSIRVRPFVSGDEQVTMNIDVENADFIGQVKPNEPPPRSTSAFTSSLRVKNEEMVLLGGIERTENSQSGSGTPILSRIPILKWLFSTRSKTKGKVVSIVFIKPTIMY